MTPSPAVRLEPLRAEHAALLFDGLSDPGLYRHLDDDPPSSLDWLTARFGALEAGAPDGVDEVWLNWVIVDGDRLVGTTQATIRLDGPTSVAYVVAAADHGRGVGRAAVDQMLDLLVVQHGVVEVQAEIAPDNDRSIRLVAALGFVDAGTEGTDRRFVRRLAR